ncbi:MAG: NAD(P)H-dependent oxidoreductase [Microbacteriaceae bacterium]|jgi:NAD(P)H-dependent FMN reductase|nr:NAD(P)H-dependent oxidoreductase [Microbacteriaceae bacterium]HPZ34331.1 NAD(P)H-dependent oxidoreductase [Microbacteriaceae bacterium]
MPRLLVVHHSPTATVRSIADAVLDGARTASDEGVEVVERHALEATIADVLAADGFILGTTANFGYISGALKHFFDTTYDATRESTARKPFSYWIHGGYDTTGAERAMTSITTGYGMRLAAPPLILVGATSAEHLEAATELGGTVAWSLTM